MSFIRRHLAPADRLGEVLFGLIMALCFTSAVRLGLEEPDNRAMLVSILGCNLAWGIVDGVMYVLGEVFERGRKVRLAREIAAAPSEAAALERIADELDDPLADLTTPEERDRLHRWVLDVLRRERPAPARVHAADLLGGLAVALIILVATLPVVAPFLLVADPYAATRVSNGVAVALLFGLGAQWGRMVGGGGLRIGAGLTVLGAALVGITIGLGG